jgi:hypothetical protein
MAQTLDDVLLQYRALAECFELGSHDRREALLFPRSTTRTCCALMVKVVMVMVNMT